MVSIGGIYRSKSRAYSMVCSITLMMDSLSIFCLLMMQPYILNQKINNFEYFLLILFSVLGLFLLCSSNDFLTSYLAIELQSLSFYVLAAFKKNSTFSEFYPLQLLGWTGQIFINSNLLIRSQCAVQIFHAILAYPIECSNSRIRSFWR